MAVCLCQVNEFSPLIKADVERTYDGIFAQTQHEFLEMVDLKADVDRALGEENDLVYLVQLIENDIACELLARFKH